MNNIARKLKSTYTKNIEQTAFACLNAWHVFVHNFTPTDNKNKLNAPWTELTCAELTTSRTLLRRIGYLSRRQEVWLCSSHTTNTASASVTSWTAAYAQSAWNRWTTWRMGVQHNGRETYCLRLKLLLLAKPLSLFGQWSRQSESQIFR